MSARVFQPDFSRRFARTEAVVDLMELACFFAQQYHGHKISDLSFDQPALQEVIFRFWRDVYGYSRFTNGLVKAEPDPGKRAAIQKLVDHLPVHIWSDFPRKTRIAAGFTYWMSVLRPFRFKEEAAVKWEDDVVAHFNAHFTAWAALLFLRRFGSYDFGVDADDRKVRKDNYLRALKVRELSLVTLEFLYGSIFRPHRSTPAKNGHPA
jgi:hypothetical protein